MLSGLRLRLTLLYLGIGLAFLLLVGAGTYALLRTYYRQSTDLALQHRLVQELLALGAPVPPDLAAADRAWYLGRGQVPPALDTATATPGADTPRGDPGDHDGDGGSGPGSGDGGDDGDASGDGGEDGDASGDGGDGGEDGADRSESEDDEHREHRLEETYDGELAAIFLLAMGADGQPLAGAPIGAPAPTAEPLALAAARDSGLDWRTVSGAAGPPVRLLTYALPDGSGAQLLQLGRPLGDQERVLGRLLAVLLGLGVVSALLLGAGGWWVAGRSLRPVEAAWRHQQAFVANASHELRTPLTLIRASAEVLGRGLPAAGDQRTLVDDIVAETDHMGQLVSDLLLLSRLDSGQAQLQPGPVPLAGLATDLERQFGRLAEARGIAFSASAGPGAVLADPSRLRQVLLALLDNALQHTPPGGAIALTAGRVGTVVSIVVSDTGEGIPPEHLPRVFDRFFSLRPAGGGGAGLGLALARALVEAQRGQIQVASTPGHGTRVTVTLPAA